MPPDKRSQEKLTRARVKSTKSRSAYIVHWNDYDSHETLGVFSALKKAKAFIIHLLEVGPKTLHGSINKYSTQLSIQKLPLNRAKSGFWRVWWKIGAKTPRHTRNGAGGYTWIQDEDLEFSKKQWNGKNWGYSTDRKWIIADGLTKEDATALARRILKRLGKL